MKISVVTASYNSARTIAYTIESFLDQSYGNKEMVIVDGASTDDTLKIVEGFRSPDVRVYSEPDRGTFDAMNKGLRLFSGDAVGFLNSDDSLHDRGVLEHLSASLSDADITYGDLLMVSDHMTKHVVRSWKAGPFRRGTFRLGWMAPHPTLYVRRNVVERVGDFDLRYKAAADYDFMLRAMELNDFRVRYTPRVLVDFQMGGISTKSWRATLEANLECLRARQIHLRAPAIDAALFLRPLRRLPQVRDARAYLFR